MARIMAGSSMIWSAIGTERLELIERVLFGPELKKTPWGRCCHLQQQGWDVHHWELLIAVSEHEMPPFKIADSILLPFKNPAVALPLLSSLRSKIGIWWSASIVYTYSYTLYKTEICSNKQLLLFTRCSLDNDKFGLRVKCCERVTLQKQLLRSLMTRTCD